MNITTIGHRKDGSFIGEDENGELYTGVKRRAGWDEVTRHVSDNLDGTHTILYMVGDYLISKGTMRTIPDAEIQAYQEALRNSQSPPPPNGFSPTYHGYVAEKKFISIPMADGTSQDFERLIDVIVWTPES